MLVFVKVWTPTLYRTPDHETAQLIRLRMANYYLIWVQKQTNRRDVLNWNLCIVKGCDVSYSEVVVVFNNKSKYGKHLTGVCGWLRDVMLHLFGSGCLLANAVNMVCQIVGIDLPAPCLGARRGRSTVGY